MKQIIKKNIFSLKGPAHKSAPSKIVVNKKIIPDGHYCVSLKKEMGKKIYINDKDYYMAYPEHICPYLEDIVIDKDESLKFCALLQLEIDFGLKVCGHKLSSKLDLDTDIEDGSDLCDEYDEYDDEFDEEE